MASVQTGTTKAARRTRRRWIAAGVVGVLAIVMAYRGLTVEPRPAREYLEVPGRQVVVLAHQGASGHAPSNTMEAFRLGMEQGADIIETDVHVTKDGVVVISHDQTIDRMSSGKGYIRNMTLAELRQYDFGYGFTPDNGQTYPYRGKGVTIPTLAEVFEAFPGVRVNIELKEIEPADVAKVWDVVKAHNAVNRVLINSFDTRLTDAWRELAGDAATMGAGRQDMYVFVAHYLPHLDWMYHPTVDAFQVPVSEKAGPIKVNFADQRFTDRAHKLGIKVHYWTINDEQTMREVIAAGADGIITDFPDVAVKVLKELGLR